MIKLLLALCLCASVVFNSAAQYAGQFRGDYLGIVIAAGNCSNERRTMNVIVEEDGKCHGTLFDWEAGKLNEFSGRIVANGVGVSVTGDPLAPDWNPLDPLNGWLVKMKCSARAGTLRGTIDGRAKGGCKYTFTLYRQFKTAQ